MIFGLTIALVECNKELWHDFYKSYVSDSMMTSATYTYNFNSVEHDFYTKTNDATRLYFFIVRENKAIGQIYLKRMDEQKKTTEFGIALTNDDVKGKGYGTEAIKLLMHHAFFTLGFEKLLADTVLGNARSRHILEKLGFAFKGEDSSFRYYEMERANYAGIMRVHETQCNAN